MKKLDIIICSDDNSSFTLYKRMIENTLPKSFNYLIAYISLAIDNIGMKNYQNDVNEQVRKTNNRILLIDDLKDNKAVEIINKFRQRVPIIYCFDPRYESKGKGPFKQSKHLKKLSRPILDSGSVAKTIIKLVDNT